MSVFVISLGGSLIHPDDIDHGFLERFTEIITRRAKDGDRFVLICGGGALARREQEAAKDKDAGISDEDLDWVGIDATKSNARVVKDCFDEGLVYERVVSNPTLQLETDARVIVASGWKPGWSTDYDAVLLAKQLGAKRVINMSNVKKVYDKDPKVHDDATPLDAMSWDAFRAMVGDEWKPGMNAPFDPIAAKVAQEAIIQVIVIGSDLKNLEAVLEDKSFVGTMLG